MSAAILGIDFGTSHTVAAVRHTGGSVLPLLFDGAPLLPSAVYAEEAGRLVVGRDAVHSARLRPERFEPHPKRCVDDGTVLLGDTEIDVTRMFAAVLERVRVEAERVIGAAPTRTVVTHPAAWGPVRRLVLSDACEQAGLGTVTMMPEPVAAAHYFARRSGTAITGGTTMVVYDFGGGTFDVSVVVAADTGFEVLAVDGSDTLGGVDIDRAVVDHIGGQYEGDDRWAQLLNPRETAQRRHHRTFVDDVRAAKERLSRDNRVDLLVPILDIDTQVTREELEALTEPLLDRAVRLTQGVIRAAAVPVERTAGVYLVGGASRMPLVATSLHRGTGIAPTVIDQPELVVATGSILGIEPPPEAPVSPTVPVSASATHMSPVPPVSPAVPATSAILSPMVAPPVTRSPQAPYIPEQPRPDPQRPPTTSPRPLDPVSTPPIRGLKPLHWVQFVMSILHCLSIVAAIDYAQPPPDYVPIVVGSLAAAVGLTVFIAIQAVRLSRESGAPRGSAITVQKTVLGVAVAEATVLILLGVPYIAVIRAVIFMPAVVAAVILVLVRLGRPPQPVTRPRILTELKHTLIIQLATATVALLIAFAWWADFLVKPGAVVDDDVPAVVAAAFLVLVTVSVIASSFVHLNRRNVMSPKSRQVLKVGQVIWMVLGSLYALPWFYDVHHRMMPFEVETTVDDLPMYRDWGIGIGGVFNELGLWMLVFSAVTALLVLIQLSRLPNTAEVHANATM